MATRILATERLTIDLAAHLTREESGLSPLLPTGVLDVDEFWKDKERDLWIES